MTDSDTFSPTTEDIRNAYLDWRGFTNQIKNLDVDDEAAGKEFDAWLIGYTNTIIDKALDRFL